MGYASRMPADLQSMLEGSLDELAASWDGTNNRVGYVFRAPSEDAPRIGWLDRSGSADRLLELAQWIKDGEAAAKGKLQKLAVQVFKPAAPGDKLQCVVVSPEAGALLAEIPPDRLTELNAAGATETAKNARRDILRRMTPLAAKGLLQFIEAGGSRDEAVVLIVDPEDRRAAPLAQVLKTVDDFDYTTQHEGGRKGPMLVVLKRSMLLEGLREARPSIAKWLGLVPPEKDVARAVCMAAGGHLLGYLRISVDRGTQE
jgi:hypothetical protein